MQLSLGFWPPRRQFVHRFGFFYGGNVENGLLTRFDSLPADEFTGGPDLLVRQFLEFTRAVVPDLNRIHLFLVNRDR